ncbi:unnamed protein product [Schistocephalus solidus]|uniref:Uncharacterized protein n=1 Tax=Schistocephalus solidus TaxID=70667 RepID=A0A183SLL3_SCHSO|nr:unnamed protein product [Schistocephalus solidus]
MLAHLGTGQAEFARNVVSVRGREVLLPAEVHLQLSQLRSREGETVAENGLQMSLMMGSRENPKRQANDRLFFFWAPSWNSPERPVQGLPELSKNLFLQHAFSNAYLCHRSAASPGHRTLLSSWR